MELADAGVLEKYNVASLGTSIETIRTAEDRELFKELLLKIGEPVPTAPASPPWKKRAKWRTKIGLPAHHPPLFYAGRHRRRHGAHLGGTG